MMRYVYEFIGTFFLVLTVGLAVLEPNSIGLWAPLAIGSILAAMVYAGGHISGGHYNPAVSLSAYLSKKLAINDLWLYWAAQLVASILAALIVIYLKDGPSDNPMDLHILKALLVEFLFTFALCYVVLNVAATKATAGNSYFGWAIGLTLIVAAYVIGSLSGAAINPAVALGLTILNASHWSNLWIYFVANLLGGTAAAWVFKAAHRDIDSDLDRPKALRDTERRTNAES